MHGHIQIYQFINEFISDAQCPIERMFSFNLRVKYWKSEREREKKKVQKHEM